MNVEHRIAIIETFDHQGDIVSVYYGRHQVKLSGKGSDELKAATAIRIGDKLFVHHPDGDEILDKEWKTGKVYGT